MPEKMPIHLDLCGNNCTIFGGGDEPRDVLTGVRDQLRDSAAELLEKARRNTEAE